VRDLTIGAPPTTHGTVWPSFNRPLGEKTRDRQQDRFVKTNRKALIEASGGNKVSSRCDNSRYTEQIPNCIGGKGGKSRGYHPTLESPWVPTEKKMRPLERKMDARGS